MKIQSTTHRLELDDATGEFTVWQLTDRQLHVTKIEGDKIQSGIVTQPDASEQKLLAAMNRMPIFAANYAGNLCFNIDYDCGFQRWHGSKAEAEVRQALRRCGFDSSQARMILHLAKVQEHNYIRRYG